MDERQERHKLLRASAERGIPELEVEKQDLPSGGVTKAIGVRSVQSLSRVRRFATPMDCSMPGFPVHHQLLKLAETHVHRVDDAIQPSHPLSSPSSPAFNLSQHHFQHLGMPRDKSGCLRVKKKKTHVVPDLVVASLGEPHLSEGSPYLP